MRIYRLKLEAETQQGQEICAFLLRYLPDVENSLCVAREKARAIEFIFPDVTAYVFRVTFKNEVRQMRHL